MQDDCAGPRVARDAMVLGSGGSLDQGTPTAPSVEDTTQTTTFQQVPQQCGVPESSCVASGFQESSSGRFSSEVAQVIKAPQREYPRKFYQSRWSIYGQWCSQYKVYITSATVPQVAEFLTTCSQSKTSNQPQLLATEQQFLMLWVHRVNSSQKV